MLSCSALAHRNKETHHVFISIRIGYATPSPTTILHLTLHKLFTSNSKTRNILNNNFNNFQMFFHNPAEIPMYQSHETINLPLHKELFLRMEPKVVTASQDLEEYTPMNRRCYFSHERPLSLFKVYTQRNCQLECRVNCSVSLCDCVPFYLPRKYTSQQLYSLQWFLASQRGSVFTTRPVLLLV